MKLSLVASCNRVETLVCQFALLVGESEATQAISWGRTCSASHSHVWWALAAWADMTLDPNTPTTSNHTWRLFFCGCSDNDDDVRDVVFFFFGGGVICKTEPVVKVWNAIMGDILLD